MTDQEELTALQARVNQLKIDVAQLEMSKPPLRGEPLWRLCQGCQGVFCCAGAYFLSRETYQVRHCPFCGSGDIKSVPKTEVQTVLGHRMRAH